MYIAGAYYFYCSRVADDSFKIKWWYRAHGGPMRLTYSGPDTGGSKVLALPAR
jgi:hypothetical protein